MRPGPAALTLRMIALAREGKSNIEIARITRRTTKRVRKNLSRWRVGGFDIPKGRAKPRSYYGPVVQIIPPVLVLPIKLGVELYRRARDIGARVHLDGAGSVFFDVRIAWIGDPAQLLTK